MSNIYHIYNIFVSDCKVELEAFNTRVYPALRDQCKQHGCQLDVIELSWGSLHDQTQQSKYTRVVAEILQDDPDTILLVSNHFPTPNTAPFGLA